jgi:exosortase family protein XrtF
VQSNKIVLFFLGKFFGVYILLFLMYSLYLNKTQSNSGVFACAPITNSVAKQTQFLLNIIGFDAKIEQHPEEVSVKLFINEKYVSRIIEGCNSISIIILFCSFVIAFSSNFKSTFLFILIGSLFIYVVNIIRIVILSIALYQFPQYEYILHDILFPLIIYGFTFLLWFIWIKKFSKI